MPCIVDIMSLLDVVICTGILPLCIPGIIVGDAMGIFVGIIVGDVVGILVGIIVGDALGIPCARAGAVKARTITVSASVASILFNPTILSPNKRNEEDNFKDIRRFMHPK
jgi:hypothetical protein